jgi:hypothetical protein
MSYAGLHLRPSPAEFCICISYEEMKEKEHVLQKEGVSSNPCNPCAHPGRQLLPARRRRGSSLQRMEEVADGEEVRRAATCAREKERHRTRTATPPRCHRSRRLPRAPPACSPRKGGRRLKPQALAEDDVQGQILRPAPSSSEAGPGFASLRLCGWLMLRTPPRRCARPRAPASLPPRSASAAAPRSASGLRPYKSRRVEMGTSERVEMSGDGELEAGPRDLR